MSGSDCPEWQCRLIVVVVLERLHPLVESGYQGLSIAAGAASCGIVLNGLGAAAPIVEQYVLSRDALAVTNMFHGMQGVIGLMAIEWGEYAEARSLAHAKSELADVGWFLLTALLMLRGHEVARYRNFLVEQHQLLSVQARNLGIDVGEQIMSETEPKNQKHRPQKYYLMGPDATVEDCLAQFGTVEMLLRTVREGEGKDKAPSYTWARGMLADIALV